MEKVSDKSCKENQNKHFLFNNLFSKIFPFMNNMENIVQADRSQMTIWRMRIACWILKAPNTQLEYVILMDFQNLLSCDAVFSDVWYPTIQRILLALISRVKSLNGRSFVFLNSGKTNLTTQLHIPDDLNNKLQGCLFLFCFFRSRSEGNKVEAKEVGWKGMDWTDLAQDRDRWWDLLNMKIKLWVP